MAGMIVINAEEFRRSANYAAAKMDESARLGISQAALAVQREAKRNASTGKHRAGTPRVNGGGPGPNVVTGFLRNSINIKVMYGFGVFAASIGPEAEYGRAVELGSSRWKNGAKYPYMEPALRTLSENGTLIRIIVSAFRMR